MKRQLVIVGVLTGWLHAAAAMAQFGQQNQNTPPANSRFLPRSNPGYVGGNSPFNPFGGYGANGAFSNAYNFNGGYGSNGANNFNGGYGFNGANNFNGGFGGFNGGGNFNGGFGAAPFGNSGNPWANPYAGNPWQNQYGMGNNFFGPMAPFGGYQFSGYGNYAPIVGVNNGWWPYSPPYNPNDPINQYMQNLFIQGLPNLNSFPATGTVLPR